MEYISVKQFAEKYGISERTARNYCAAGKITGSFLMGKTWNIPADARTSTVICMTLASLPKISSRYRSTISR